MDIGRWINMIYVFEDGAVVYDGSRLTEAQKSKAVAVDALPMPEKIVGKDAVLKANKAEERVYYDYVDKQADPELEQLKTEVAMQDAVLEDLLGNVLPMLMMGGV